MSSESLLESDRRVDRRKPIIFLSALLAAAVVATFLPVARNGFVNYDDPDYVTANARVLRGFSWENLSWALRTDYAANWHPVTWLSHMLDVALFGQNATGHHLTSIFLHALTTAYLFLLFWKMTGATGRSFVLAALFGLHPLRVESVAWISERKDVLAAFFGVLTLWFYVLWAKRRETGIRAAAAYYGTAIACFALGLMCKSMLVTLPFVMLLLDYWPLQRWQFSMPKAKAARLVIEKLPFFVLAAAVSAITLAVQRNAGAVKTMTSYPVSARWGERGRFLLPVSWRTLLSGRPRRVLSAPNLLAAHLAYFRRLSSPWNLSPRASLTPHASLFSNGMALVRRDRGPGDWSGSGRCTVNRRSLHLHPVDRGDDCVGLGNV